MPRSLPLAAALGALLAAPAFAQDPAAAGDDQAVTLDRVVVSASTIRLPYSDAALPNTITVIDGEQLARQLALTQDLSQVLANLIPAFAPSRQKMSSFGESLRGRQPLYMVDGVPQSTPLRDGSRDAHTIDPAMIERIEVIHGANALQGLGASGGIINVITKRAPREDGASFRELSLGASVALPREHDDAGMRASWLYGTRQGAFDFVGGLSSAQEGLFHDADGRAIAVDTVQGDLMDARSANLFAKLGWDLGERRRLQASVNRYRLRGDGDYTTVPGDYLAGIPATSTEGEPPLDPPRNDVTSLSLDYTDRDLATGYFQGQLFWTRFEALYGSFGYTDFFGPGTGLWLDQSRIDAEKVGGKFTWSRDGFGELPLRLTFGLDLLRDRTEQSMQASGLGWVPPSVYESVSPLLQAEYRIGARLLLTGGLRHERARIRVDDYVTQPRYGSQFVEGGSQDARETLRNFGAVYDVSDALKLYASYAEGYTVADIGRVLRGISTPGQRVEDLVDLTPVIADNREVGVDYDDGRWSAHVAAYWSDSDLGSLLIFDSASNSYNVQRQATRIRGIEANLAWQATEDTRVGLAHARAQGEYDSNGDDRVDSDLQGINISPDRTTAFWEQRWTPGFSTRLQASHAADRGFERRGVEVSRFAGYTTVDLQGQVALPLGRLAFGVENLLGRQYITYYSQTTPSDEDYVAGRGRVFSVNGSHRF